VYISKPGQRPSLRHAVSGQPYACFADNDWKAHHQIGIESRKQKLPCVFYLCYPRHYLLLNVTPSMAVPVALPYACYAQFPVSMLHYKLMPLYLLLLALKALRYYTALRSQLPSHPTQPLL